MGWAMQAMPLQVIADGAGGWDWVTSVPSRRGLPERPPESGRVPTVAEVVTAFHTAGCHGSLEYRITDRDDIPPLIDCTDHTRCAQIGGRDLGEVDFYAESHGTDPRDVSAADFVQHISFRKPITTGVLAAMCALAATAGPQVIFDDHGDEIFVVWPGETLESLAAEWPWWSAQLAGPELVLRRDDQP